ncbi:MAG TPA: hypothetical protein ENL45_00825 [Candidatus Woesearchaeota archaeon]|nr:hypothetical protein [Candidatus Woesearchaeota archaeon]
MAIPKRKVATKILVNDILTSTYIKRPGWEPSGILTKQGEVSRVHLMGVVVSLAREENSISLLLDDGSGNIVIRIFDNTILPENVSLGSLVSVVGKPREWNNSKYIVPEHIKLVQDKRWYEVHQKQIKLFKKTNSIKLPVDKNEESSTEIGPYQKILNTVAILDKGKGASVEEIISNLNLQGTDKIIQALIEEGEVFEISPGRVKVLE